MLEIVLPVYTHIREKNFIIIGYFILFSFVAFWRTSCSCIIFGFVILYIIVVCLVDLNIFQVKENIEREREKEEKKEEESAIFDYILMTM